MVLEINASDDNGIGVVRDTVSAFARTSPLFAPVGGAASIKLIVLDEAEHLTPDAQAALKRIMEEVSATARFCFVCNCERSISPAIQSRCARFRFRPLTGDAVRSKIRHVAAAENLLLLPGTEDALVSVGQGDMRCVLNTMQSCAFRGSAVTPDDVFVVSGRPATAQVADIVHAMTTLPVSEACAVVRRVLADGGLSLADVVSQLGALVIDASFPLYCASPDIASPVMCYLVKHLAAVELALSNSAPDDTQAAAVVAAFALARHMLGPSSSLSPASAPPPGGAAERAASQ